MVFERFSDEARQVVILAAGAAAPTTRTPSAPNTCSSGSSTPAAPERQR
ncbi:hypothetical protein R4282_32280 [Rhodococcus oxybenzonivorans]|nr:hypothetical protein [Rhodococcus oxybenzonivorans]MDV7357673.1 hypothetical protein [Rhodococcus oxybenzonivorans]